MPSEFEKLCRKRVVNNNKLASLIVKTSAPDLSKQQLKLYIDQVEQYWSEANITLVEMCAIAKDDELGQIQADFDAVEKQFDEQRIKLTTLLDTASATSASSEVKLPKLELPSFSGKPEEWLSFHDLFLVSVHNNPSLTGSQKLQYLKTALKGDAAKLIQSSVITDTNYASAWNRVVKRYHNKREIVHAVIKKLMTQPNITTESPTALRTLVDTTNECISGLIVLSRPVDQWDDLLVFTLIQKLDPDSRREWEMSLENEDPPNFSDLMDFVEQRARALVSLEESQTKPSVKLNTRVVAKSHVSKPSTPCILCKEDHLLFRCPKFNALSVEARIKCLQNNSLCFNCLRKGHSASNCNNERRCQKCTKKHHTSIHQEKREKEPSSTAPTSTVPALTTQDDGCDNVLLATAIVKVRDVHGGQQQLRALIDNGSQRSLITESVVQQLCLPREKTTTDISGVGGSVSATSRGKVRLLISSCTTPNFSLSLNALVIRKITAETPPLPTPTTTWSHLANVTLADPSFFLPGRIDILLGADVYGELLRDGRRKGSPGTPTALNTALGWILLGPTSTSDPTSVTSLVLQQSLDSKLEKFWELEQLPSTSLLTPDERLCEESFRLTHTREPNGKYVVELPFRPNHPPLGSSLERARVRFLQQERRLQTNPEHKQLYVAFMQEYERMGHMIRIPDAEIECPVGSCYYLPHHAVFKWSSSTTKCRVVFDASAQTSSGSSLNDILLNGPTLQETLYSHLLRFRSHLVPFVGDIEKMYRMVGVAQKHWNFQRILWREEPRNPIQHFWLVVLTFGTKSAPFLAVRALRQCALDESLAFPLAHEVVMRDFYVDNLMSGSDNIQDAKEAARQLPLMLSRGNFNLREWFSSSQELLMSVPEHLRGSQNLLPMEQDETVGTLGLRWHIGFDSFKYAVQPPKQHVTLTKRKLASDIASIYDPLGWLAPITVIPKDLIRRTWQLKVDWDAEVPTSIRDDWTSFTQSLPLVQQIYIPRCLTHPQVVSLQLCGFSDASERAYAACLYVRCETSEGIVHTNLVTAKNKIAPISQQSLPRLELCGALLLVQLMNAYNNCSGLTFNQFHAWTDSKIVLAWLQSHPRRWTTFVANRVAAIQDCGLPLMWHHVSSKDNPADAASRGISTQELLRADLWWYGPLLLRHSLPTPDDLIAELPERAREEERPTAKVNHTKVGGPSFISNFSSLSTLCRMTAYARRFAFNLRCLANQRNQRPSPEPNRNLLTSQDVNESLMLLVRLVQGTHFLQDMQLLMKAKPLPSNSRLNSLCPFIDAQGVLRVGGRIQRANVSGDQKHPILLPRQDHLVTLIIRSEHLRLLHAGPQALLASLGRRFWILNSRDAVRKVVSSCLPCVRLRADTAKQMMGNLPTSRVIPSRPFLECGVDYAGPVQLRVLKGRGTKHFKGYIALFVSFSVRAVHLELVSELTTEAFIAALIRFTARRGKPKTIHSDNGTNFVGANRKLLDLYKETNAIVRDQRVHRHLTDEGITWKFNPPGAPHFGGLWEAGVRSMKYHLNRVIGDVTLDFEQMTTILTQVEACLNSRPLCPLSSDPADLSALTPSHFLIGDVATALPDNDYFDVPMNRLSRWQLCQRISQHFWKRWSSEYLSRLQQRPKWLGPKVNISVNDLVLLKEEQRSPLQWKLARIQEVHPGPDGLVRVVTLRLADGVLKRPIHKVCPLPIHHSESSEVNGEDEDDQENSVFLSASE